MQASRRALLSGARTFSLRGSQRNASTLVVAVHDSKSLNPSTLSAVTAASKIGGEVSYTTGAQAMLAIQLDIFYEMPESCPGIHVIHTLPRLFWLGSCSFTSSLDASVLVHSFCRRRIILVDIELVSEREKELYQVPNNLH